MAFKHQDQSYRTRNGLRFECVADICDETNGPLQAQVKAMVRELRAQGRKAFAEKQDGFYRVFASIN